MNFTGSREHVITGLSLKLGNKIWKYEPMNLKNMNQYEPVRFAGCAIFAYPVLKTEYTGIYCPKCSHWPIQITLAENHMTKNGKFI